MASRPPQYGGRMAAEGPVASDAIRAGRRYSPQRPEKQLRLAASPRDHLADDFRHQGIRQDYTYNLKLQVRLPYPSLKSLPPINRSRKTQIPGVRYRGF